MTLKDVTMNVPFQKKPYIKAGRGDWEVVIPRPPKFATHARMRCVDPLSPDSTPKYATLPINDFGCFKGVYGEFSYIRMNNSRKVLEEYNGTWEWDGHKVLGVDYEI